MPDLLLADTNPKAAGIYCILLLLASHPCRAFRFTLAFPVTRTNAESDEHMIDYKYSGKGLATHATHCTPQTVLISALPRSSLAALFCVKSSHICSLDTVDFRQARPCGLVAVLLWAGTVLVRCVGRGVTSRASGVVCLLVFASEGEKCYLESTCATQ